MRLLSFLLTASVITLSSCLGEGDIPEPVIYNDLTIDQTLTPTETTVGETFASKVKVTLPNPCYKFSGFEVRNVGSNNLEIRAKGQNIAKAGEACAEMLVTIDTTLQLKSVLMGKYFLKFYNKDNLLKTDTIEVKEK
ncbi:hypothetical protein [Solitalea lacus]|uniref:hypothetical protein n=1 Tax=Solitalea lacus TaxID=2911172 RepID=UPI001EDB32F6|nr:hypothetical protein [Solitalea lacus]UKJ08613.1 hypothetical protein L2B55_05460 [Solitalea lacus]